MNGLTLRNIFFDEKIRSILIQAFVVGLIGVGIYSLIQTTSYNLDKRGIDTGFEFLKNPAGYDISLTLIPYTNTDTHLQAYFVGLINTLFIAVTGCFVATIIGFTIGIIRLSTNWLFRNFAYAYVEATRNVPILLHIIFWYTVLLELPKIKEAASFLKFFFLSNRGVYSPAPILQDGMGIVFIFIIFSIVFSIIFNIWAKKKQESTGVQLPVFLINSGVIIFLPIIVFIALGMPLLWDHPVLKGFNFKGGMVIRPEFVAMLLGLGIYTGSYIAEIVRSGIISVSKGQREAASALGLKKNIVMKLVIIPQALRVIIPPLTNQYLNLTKNSSLGIAIGYADLVHGFGGISLNITGQAIEIMAMVMATYLTISLTISLFMNLYNKSVQFKGNT